MTTRTSYWCEHAWLPDGPRQRTRIETQGGVITAVHPETEPVAGDERLPGMVFPGFADAHSHAFHRALRGRTHHGAGSFWTWRDAMYTISAQLDPDSCFALARACYAELVAAGVTAIGEFHYLHHGPGGMPYSDPNAMGQALIAAAQEAGLRLTLLDTCYLAGGLGPGGYEALNGVQRRFSDGNAERWASRVTQLASAGAKPGSMEWTSPESARIGVAAHSVRAVPPASLPVVAGLARNLRADGWVAPLHTHLSEQPAENEACRSVSGLTPAQLLDQTGLLGPNSTVVHATHLSAADIVLLGRTTTTACICPSTERDLADGIGPARDLLDAGSPLALGSDQHVSADPLAEAAALEMDQRLVSLHRGRFSPAELVAALTVSGHAAIGRPEGGRIAAGAPADLVAVGLGTARTAGAEPGQIVLVAGAADVDTVVIAGRTVVEGGQHALGDVGALLAAAIDPLWDQA